LMALSFLTGTKKYVFSKDETYQGALPSVPPQDANQSGQNAGPQ